MPKTRNYGLFRKVDGKWVRVPGTGAYPKPTAVRIFQNHLLGSAFSDSPMELRVVPEEKSSRIPASQVLCHSCENHSHDLCSRGACACGCRIHERRR